MVEGFANGQHMSEHRQRAGAATRNAVAFIPALAIFGRERHDATIDGRAIGVAREIYVRAQHARQQIIAFRSLRRLAPIDGRATQPRERGDGGVART